MSEINELRERLEIAERKIAVLEETFETLKNMRTSERMNDYINNQKRNLALVNLINSASDNEQIDLSEQRNAVEKVMQERSHIEEHIANAISKSYTEPQYDMTNLFEYQPYEDGIEIKKYIGFDDEEIIVPNKINGLPVVRIGDDVFQNCPLKKILLPETLRELGRGVFRGCESLKTIDLPESLVEIGMECFAVCGFNEMYINVETIRPLCFTGCKLLNNVTIGEKAKKIMNSVFSGTAIQRIIIPKNVIKLRGDVFNSCRIKCIAFCGMTIDLQTSHLSDKNIIIYCLPGSDAQKYAREHCITVKPLSEFPKD